MLSSNKHGASLTNSKKAPSRRKTPKKAIVSYAEPEARPEDFVLFPDIAIIEKHSCSRRQRSQRVRQELIADGLLPSTDDDPLNANNNKLSPLQRGAKRRLNLTREPTVHHSEASPQRNTKMPPVPCPPRLGTPDLDDIDEDLWSCCTWSEGSVESYIAASRYRLVRNDHCDAGYASPADSNAERATNAKSKTMRENCL